MKQTLVKNFIKNEIDNFDEPYIDPELLKRGQLSQNFNIKIADLGNGCYIHHHF